MLMPKGGHLFFRVDNPTTEMDFNAELKTLQTSVKELQTENQGMNLLVVATFIKILTAHLIKFPINFISWILFSFSDFVLFLCIFRSQRAPGGCRERVEIGQR